MISLVIQCEKLEEFIRKWSKKTHTYAEQSSTLAKKINEIEKKQYVKIRQQQQMNEQASKQAMNTVHAIRSHQIITSKLWNISEHILIHINVSSCLFCSHIRHHVIQFFSSELLNPHLLFVQVNIYTFECANPNVSCQFNPMQITTQFDPHQILFMLHTFFHNHIFLFTFYQRYYVCWRVERCWNSENLFLKTHRVCRLSNLNSFFNKLLFEISVSTQTAEATEAYNFKQLKSF